MFLNKDDIKSAAAGRWDQIFATLAPKLKDAQAHPGHHVPCPVHGGKDGFRLFPNYAETGQCICNSCGAKTDGFATLQWVNGWSFRQALLAVAQFLRCDSGSTKHPELQPASQPDEQNISDENTSSTGRIFRGVLLSAGPMPYKDTGKRVYTAELLQGEDRLQCVGVDLEVALQAAGAQRGDLVELHKVRTEKRTSPRGEYLYNVWEAKVLSQAKQYARVAPSQPASAPTKPTQSDRHNRHASIEKLWGMALPIQKDRAQVKPVLDYLGFRGVAEAKWSDDALRFVPKAIYKSPDGTRSEHPAMVAAVRSLDGKLVTLHRTFLSNEGRKADVQEPKKLMALGDGETMRGAAVQLGKPADVLCIAEGIETALSVQLATGLPCWSAVSANGMRAVEIPERVRTVLIFPDKDASRVGQEAAEDLRRRLAQERRLAVIINIEDEIPEGSKGLDWNDILKTKGVAGFPVQRHR